MALIKKTKFPIDAIFGRIGGIDRTVGREGGLAVNIRKRRHSTQLSTKTMTPIARSAAFKERTYLYCSCDDEWKLLSDEKRTYPNTYYRAVHEISTWTLTDYQTFMKLCLLAILEKAAFAEFSWLARYKIINTEAAAWENKIVRLIDINVKRVDGKDLQVFKIDLSKNIISEMEHKIDGAGSTLVKIPFLDTGVFFFADVYSYSDYIHYEAW